MGAHLTESYPRAAAILRDAGWAPHNGYGVYTQGTLVMGWAPSGKVFHVKNWAAVMPGDPRYSADTPDTPEEAAEWLVRTQGGAPGVEASNDRTDSLDLGGDLPSGDPIPEHFFDGDFGAEPDLGGSDLALAERESLGAEILDAEYEELERERLGIGFADPQPYEAGADADPFALPEPEPMDFIPEETKREEHGPGAFIFGDNLAHDRLVRQGELTNHAADLIASVRVAAGWSDAEFVDLNNHVVSNLDKGTGAYTGGAHDKYARFVEMSEAQSRVRRIEASRDERVSAMRTATREEVVACNPLEGWP